MAFTLAPVGKATDTFRSLSARYTYPRRLDRRDDQGPEDNATVTADRDHSQLLAERLAEQVGELGLLVEAALRGGGARELERLLERGVELVASGRADQEPRAAIFRIGTALDEPAAFETRDDLRDVRGVAAKLDGQFAHPARLGDAFTSISPAMATSSICSTCTPNGSIRRCPTDEPDWADHTKVYSAEVRAHMLWVGLAGASKAYYDAKGLGQAMELQLRVGISGYCGIADAAVHVVYDTIERPSLAGIDNAVTRLIMSG